MTTANPSSNPSSGKKQGAAKKPDFEYSLTRLEEIVGKLENANLSLDDAMKLFEEGMQLSRDCQKHLEQAEGKVEILLKRAGGEMAAEPFNPEAEAESQPADSRQRVRATPPPDDPSRIFRRRPSRCRHSPGMADAAGRCSASLDP